MDAKILTKEEEAYYSTFLLNDSKTLIYYSLKYRDLIKAVTGAEDKYIIVKENNEILGVLPAFIKTNNEYGNALNSLPFYGSNGGATVKGELPVQKIIDIKKMLLERFYELEKEYDCISSTIITSPFETDTEFYNKNCQYQHIDYRIGQITDLTVTGEDPEQELMEKYHHKTRNMVRKAIKNNVECFQGGDIKDLEVLYNIHKKNILALNGIPKPFTMFEFINNGLESGRDYKIFFAWKNDIVIAGLLLLYYNKTVEYFTPAIEEEYRGLQPLSMLIYESMIDAVKKGYKYYNFGGTWESQEGVHRFKKRWGAKDLKYTYFTKLNRDIDYFKKIGKDNLLSEFNYFYVIDFNKLSG